VSEPPGTEFSPVGRRGKRNSHHRNCSASKQFRATLRELGYQPVTASKDMPLNLKVTRRTHRSFVEAKLWFKHNRWIRALAHR